MSLGTPLPHDSAALHVTGQARYVDDIPLPGDALHLAFGLSTVAHGVITGMDLSAVRAAPGVVDVITHADLARPADTSPAWHDEPLLADGTVHYVGQPVFLVIATSHRAALRAARLGRIAYDERPAILTIDDALAAGSHFEGGPVVWSRGDAAAALAAAPHVLEGTMEIGGQEHFYLEGQAAAAIPGEGGDMHILSSTQHPSEVQEKVAEALGLPMHSVRVECRRMGGGFGGKESQGNAPAVACAVAAERTGRPCRMRYDRDDDFVITGKRHDFRIRYRVGFDDRGRILGLDMQHLVRCGWSRDLSTPVADRAMLHTDNAYFIPHIRIESHRLRTNTQSNTAFRGFGGPQGVLAIERVIDHIAHSLGLDPLAVRRANLYAEGQTTHYGQPVTHFALPRMIDRLAESADYVARRKAAAAWNAANPVLKRGIALTPVKFGISFTLTHMNQAGALVHVYHDGSIHLNHGGTEMGQGLFQKVAQVAAAEFGVPLGAVRITATDTAKVPNTAPTAASSGSDLNGMAVQAACAAIKARMAEHLAGLHQADPATVRFEGGRVKVGGSDMTFAEAATRCWRDRVGLSAAGHYKTPDISWDRAAGKGRPFFYFAHGAAVTEVVIDTLTGEYRILRVDILHDCGASLNPAIDIGQIEGGFVQGTGWLTTEELVWDGRGRLRTHAPATYKIPACSDRPRVFNVTLWDEPNAAATIGRSKAVGEPPLMLAASVFLALSDAVAACGAGYPALDAPATPERVLMAVRRVQA
jgi:xanthine dehydrogenase large subunit